MMKFGYREGSEILEISANPALEEAFAEMEVMLGIHVVYVHTSRNCMAIVIKFFLKKHVVCQLQANFTLP